MSKYTTGEMARLCGVSVRTVQYYDNRELLSPSELSEGGRRLYSEEDLRLLRIICFLRSAGLSITSIQKLLREEDPGSVIEILLEQQSRLLREEIEQRQEQLQKVEHLSREIRGMKHFSVESIGDIAYMMENKKKLRNVRLTMLGVGIVLDVIEWTVILLWILQGIWVPFVIGIPVVIAGCIWITLYYFKKVDYICPQCHTVFKPALKEAFWARHTPTTRRLTCTCCGHKGFCVETYAQEE